MTEHRLTAVRPNMLGGRSTLGWAAPKRVRRFQAIYRHKGVSRVGLMHAARWHRFWYGMDWVPACMTPEQERKWGLLGRIPGRALTAGALAPLTCSTCIDLTRNKKPDRNPE